MTAAAKTKAYGDNDPALTYSITPALVGGDSFVGALSRIAGENVGNYAINQGTLALSANYVLNYVGANLVVHPVLLGVTAGNFSRVYGATNPVFTASYSGFVNGETTAIISGTPSLTTTADANSVVGTYVITAALGTLTAANYNFVNFTNGTLTVTPAAITVTANSTNRTYGAANPSFAASYGGFINGDTALVISGSSVLATVAGTNSAVGTYAITAALGSLSATNYSFNFVSGTLTVNPAALSVSANDDSKTYDGNSYSGGNGVSYSGLVNGETGAVLGGTLSYGGTAQGSINSGTYSITPSGLNSGNYDVAYHGGTLTINPLTINVTADAQSKSYGHVDPPLTYQSTPALVSGDSFSGALTRATGESVGNYAISQGTLALGANYTLNYIGTNFVIGPATLSLTANNDTKIYGRRKLTELARRRSRAADW